MNLNDTQLVLLSAAAQRDDHLLIHPKELTSKAAEKLAAKLIRLGAAEEVRVGPDQPRWREEDGNPVGLRITQAGLEALGIDGNPSDPNVADAPSPAPAQTGPRAGSKQAMVIEMLGRERGATLDDLVAATGWLPHTTRAALTGLRKKGHQLVKSKEDERGTVYRTAAAAAQQDGGAE